MRISSQGLSLGDRSGGGGGARAVPRRNGVRQEMRRVQTAGRTKIWTAKTSSNLKMTIAKFVGSGDVVFLKGTDGVDVVGHRKIEKRKIFCCNILLNSFQNLLVIGRDVKSNIGLKDNR